MCTGSGFDLGFRFGITLVFNKKSNKKLFYRIILSVVKSYFTLADLQSILVSVFTSGDFIKGLCPYIQRDDISYIYHSIIPHSTEVRSQ